MNKRLAVILSIVTLDAIGIGLIFPILPSLLKEITGSGSVSLSYGVILALYSLAQFIFSPVLGALSDRFGRRPVLLVSIAGATIDFLVMATSKAFWVLLVGRAISGMTAANLAVATAYISDITEEHERAQRFGYMSACFGIGFIIGPVLGGLLGAMSLRSPFLAAALLNALNFVLVYAVLPESRSLVPAQFDLFAINPLAPMRRALSLTALVPLFAISLIFGLVGNIPGTIWVLYTEDRFNWNGVMVGLSLAVVRPVSRRSAGLSHRPDRETLRRNTNDRDRNRLRQHGVRSHGLGNARLGGVRSLAALRARRRRFAGLAVVDGQSGQRRQAGRASGCAGEHRESHGDHRAARRYERLRLHEGRRGLARCGCWRHFYMCSPFRCCSRSAPRSRNRPRNSGLYVSPLAFERRT